MWRTRFKNSTRSFFRNSIRYLKSFKWSWKPFSWNRGWASNFRTGIPKCEQESKFSWTSNFKYIRRSSRFRSVVYIICKPRKFKVSDNAQFRANSLLQQCKAYQRSGYKSFAVWAITPHGEPRRVYVGDKWTKRTKPILEFSQAASHPRGDQEWYREGLNCFIQTVYKRHSVLRR